ncbi:MAG: BREX-1 system adenine-specific DNA-methyltransferase PglX [Gammaproteobacteria bacterium]|nr:BREX-1 system adenine-specific DNA-methyltransferase PglX [Gammaproteobacteria bacterium]
METAQLKKFARSARRSLMEQVAAKLALVLPEGSTARRERAEAVRALEQALMDHSKDQVIERVAYTWFNRFCALRFMDVNRYTRTGVVSPTEGQSQPELLAEAKMGHIDENMAPAKTRQQVFALLDGSAPSSDPQGEAYRLLLVAACNSWNKAMPFLFQPIDDYTELLMPDDLLSGHSTLAHVREAMTPDVCEDVEVIGWLYQFYISEKKDEVFEGLKKNRKITPENIPAATQLFTPHWIVRYLVENSLGRLWMLNRPNSKLTEQMEYYIRPEQAESDFLRIDKPEEIRICDPACGSGHMLTYAFDLLYAIYEEEGHEPAEIPEKILTHNLYGIEIDPRAGALAAFALSMKARARQRRFFSRGIEPNICVLEKICFDEDELEDYLDFIGRDLFTASLQTTLRQFEEADNFGSLIRPDVSDVEEILWTLEARNVTGQLFLNAIHKMVLQALQQVDYLSPRYHIVIANPPYMGGKGMNGRLGAWAKDNYPNSKSDLFATFIERNLDLAQNHGIVAMITMQSWMSQSSFETLRIQILGQNTLLSMAHLGARAFDSIGGEVVTTTAFVLENKIRPGYQGAYLRLVDGRSEHEKASAMEESIKNPDCGWFYRASAADFKQIPGSPVVYWLSSQVSTTFKNSKPLSDLVSLKAGMSTGDNVRFQRHWHEVSNSRTNKKAADSADAQKSGCRWFPCNSGGTYRKWYGNHSVVVNWEMNGVQIRRFDGSAIRNDNFYFMSGITWSKISSGAFAARFRPTGFLFDDTGRCGFTDGLAETHTALAFLCSCLSNLYLRILSPTLSFTSGELANIPYAPPPAEAVYPIAKNCGLLNA